MSLNFIKCMSSEIFQLNAENDAMFYVHRGVLAFHSEPFQKATSGEWKEAAERQIQLTDWDGETVGRMIEFMYTGGYEYPNPKRLVPLVRTNAVATVPAAPVPLHNVPASANRPLTPFKECLHDSTHASTGLVSQDTHKITTYSQALYDFKTPLLCHAKVYALAHYKSIVSLKQLALKHLHLTLSQLDPLLPHNYGTRAFIELARYVYDNTDHLSNSPEALRNIISQFAALNIRQLQTEPKALRLLGEGGDFVIDVMAKVCRRLPAAAPVPVEIGRFVSSLKVVHGYDQLRPDCEYVRELGSERVNVNHPNDSPIFLILEFTNRPGEACTEFVISSSSYRRSDNNIGRLRGLDCFINGLHDVGVPDKITEVALMRCGHELRALRGYDGVSANILQGWGTGEYLYLVWRTTAV